MMIRIPHLYKNSGRKTEEEISEAAKCAVLTPLKYQVKEIRSLFPKEFYFNKKEKYGFCTFCESEVVPTDLIRHEKTYVCPKCEKTTTARNIRLYKDGKNFRYRAYVEFWRRGKKGTFSVPIVKSLREIFIENGKVDVHTTETPLSVLVISGEKRFRFSPSKSGLVLNNKTNFVLRGMWGEPLLEVIANQALPIRKSEIKGTVFEYYCNALSNAGFSANAYTLAHMTKIVEKLLSAGFTGIAKDLMNRYFDSVYRKTLDSFEDRPKIHQMLGISKRFLDSLSKKEKEELTLNFFEKRNYIQKIGLPEEYVKMSYYTIKNLVEDCIKRKLDPKKTIIRYRGRTREYLDYVDALRIVGEYPNEPSFLYPSPNRLKALHDEMINRLEAKRAEERRIADEQRKLLEQNRERLIQEYAEELKVFQFKNEKYLIRPLLSSTDMIHESEVMHHCIRTYQDKYAARTTSLFTIRRINEPDIPICSVEIKHKENGWFLVQSRMKFNADPDDELKTFVQEWLQTVADYCKCHKRKVKKLYKAA